MTAGAAWVERYLLPLFARYFSDRSAVSCLQMAPDDPTESERLREAGHACVVESPKAGQKLMYPDATFDFAFTGRFPVLARDHHARVALAKELNRVLGNRGALLLAVGNRLCPLDLTRNGSLIHGPFDPSCLSLLEAEGILISEAGFKRVELLDVNGHFGWGSLPAFIRPLGRTLRSEEHT